jgi:gamma-glutamyltranspeptidase/glutathione hydrolase
MTPTTASDRPVSGSYRPDIVGRDGMVSAGHHLAALAGQRILDRGGNAVDAGVAAALCLSVLETDMVNLAGVAPIMVHVAATGETVTISGLGRWPRRATLEFFADDLAGTIPFGVLRWVTPAAVDAWVTAVAGDALQLAVTGFPMHPMMAATLRRASPIFAQWPSTAAIFMPGGRLPEPGDVFVQKDLGATLSRLVEAEDSAPTGDRLLGLAAVRDRFYEGDIAEEICSFNEAEGGFLRMEDMISFRVAVERPVTARFGEYEIATCGPWSQGPVLGQAMAMLATDDLGSLRHNSTAYMHLLTEVLKLAFADREEYYGDPDFVAVPIEAMVTADYGALRRSLVDDERAHPEMPPPGDPERLLAVRDGAVPPPHDGGDTGSQDTTYVCVVDRHGNVFSATPSDGCLEGPVTPGTGLGVSPRGAQSWARRGHPSSIAPGKRPRLTPNPAILFRAGRPVMPIGTPGADVQCQAMLQVLVNMVVFGMSPQTAVEAPRFASYSFPESFEPHSYRPGLLRLERSIGEDVGEQLAARGHTVEWWPDWAKLAGGVCTIRIDRDRGTLAGAADPRRMGCAIGW